MNIKDNFLFHLPWKAAFKDVAKFYFYIVIFYALAIFLVWGHAYLALENVNADLEYLLSHPLSAEIEIREFNWESYKILAREMRFYMFLLVCFGVFFAVPPKNYIHVTHTAFLIFLIPSPLFIGAPISVFLEYFLFFAGSVFLAWLCSVIWHKFQRKQIDKKF